MTLQSTNPCFQARIREFYYRSEVEQVANQEVGARTRGRTALQVTTARKAINRLQGVQRILKPKKSLKIYAKSPTILHSKIRDWKHHKKAKQNRINLTLLVVIRTWARSARLQSRQSLLTKGLKRNSYSYRRFRNSLLRLKITLLWLINYLPIHSVRRHWVWSSKEIRTPNFLGSTTKPSKPSMNESAF